MKPDYRHYCILLVIGLSFIAVSPAIKRLPVQSQIQTTGASSLMPLPFVSSTEQLFLFFNHEVSLSHATSLKTYFTYQMQNLSWSNPVSTTVQLYTVFDIVTTDIGFRVYAVDTAGVYYQDYQTSNASWLERQIVLSYSVLLEEIPGIPPLTLPQERESYYLSILTATLINMTPYVVWTYVTELIDDEDPRSQDRTYIVSHPGQQNEVISQEIQGVQLSLGENFLIRFVSNTTHNFLFVNQFQTFSLFQPQTGLWTNWHASNTLLRENILSANNGWVIGWGLSNQDVYTTIEILSLIPEIQSTNPVELPVQQAYDVQATPFTATMTETGIFTFIEGQGIQYWKLNLQNFSWTLESELSRQLIRPDEYYNFYIPHFPEIKTVALIDDSYHVFWAEQFNNSQSEIFSVFYSPENASWGSIIRVTDASTITDDIYIGGDEFPLFFILISPLAFMVYVSGFVLLVLVFKFRTKKNK